MFYAECGTWIFNTVFSILLNTLGPTWVGRSRVPLGLWGMCLYSVEFHSAKNWSWPLLPEDAGPPAWSMLTFPSSTICAGAVPGNLEFLGRILINWLLLGRECWGGQTGATDAVCMGLTVLDTWSGLMNLSSSLGGYGRWIDSGWRILIPNSVPEFYPCIRQVFY